MRRSNAASCQPGNAYFALSPVVSDITILVQKRRDQDWGASLKQVYAFDTVEDFWWYVSRRRAGVGEGGRNERRRSSLSHVHPTY